MKYFRAAREVTPDGIRYGGLPVGFVTAHDHENLGYFPLPDEIELPEGANLEEIEEDAYLTAVKLLSDEEQAERKRVDDEVARQEKWNNLLRRKQAGEDVQAELSDFLRNKEEVYLFFAQFMSNPDRLAAVLDAVEAQLDLNTDLLLILADHVNPELTAAQKQAVQAIKEQLVPLRAIALSEALQNYRFDNLLYQKQLTRSMQQEYFTLKEAKPE